MDLNKVILVGRATANPELKSIPNGTAVVTLGVATGRTWTDKSGQKQSETEFSNVVFWGRQAEIVGQYVVKGALILIEGRLRTRTWKDKNGGDRRTTEVMAERLQLGPKPQGATTTASRTAPARRATAAPSLDDSQELPQINLEEDEEIKPEDIQF